MDRKKFEKNVIIINGDEYRSRHPHYLEISQEYGIDAPAYTPNWVGKMTEGLIDEFSRMGYNLIVEGTLRTKDAPMKTAKLLRERGYDISLALMAVKPEISLVSCQIRYEQMRLAGTTPRAVDPKHHDKIVREIAGNLDALGESGLFSEICLYMRARERIFPQADETSHASEALKALLFGPWAEEERIHLEYLEDELELLKCL